MKYELKLNCRSDLPASNAIIQREKEGLEAGFWQG